MTETEKLFLEDTIIILMDYDGNRTVEGLKGLIDETSERLTKLSKGEVTEEDNAGISE